jgi:Raf kinase inhibitor-like YbhB/YbcL family protein
MDTRRAVLEGGGSVALAAIAGCTDTVEEIAGDDGETGGGSGETAPPPGESDSLSVTSESFDAGDAIPERFTCDGADVSPPLSIAGIPAATEALALVLDDPDAPGGTFTHWTLWNVPAGETTIPEDILQTETVEDLDGARQGSNDFDEVGYRGPCPPEGDDPHTYRFRAYALESSLDVDPGAAVETVTDALADSGIAGGELTGTYGR